ncbi:hypothetical protein BDV11DRAFT_215708 [Aspergillus similis]
MAEPFSVAGSVVGVISLGLTVSQGFLAYYGPYQSFHEEIEMVTTRMEALKGMLEIIQTLITESNKLKCPSVAQSTQIASNIILSCEIALQKLQGMLDSCCASTPPKRLAMAEVKAHVNRLLYPFRRQTLMSLIESVSWLQDNLNTSLQMLQISLTIVGHNQMQSILTKSAAMSSETNYTAQTIQQLDHQSKSIDHSLVRLERRLDKMESRVIASSTPLIPNSDLLQSLLGTQRNLETAMTDSSTRGTPGSATHSRSKYALFHNNGCLLHAPGARTINLLMRRTICNRLLRFSVSASLQITVGTGGFAISPKLAFRPVVPEDSPAFTLLLDVEASFRSGVNRSAIRDTSRRLFELFREGKSSPSDTLADGRTILHIVTSWQYYTWEWDADLWEDWRRFINELLNTGLSPSQVDYRGATPADNMIGLYESYYSGHDEPARKTATIAICSDLMKDGGHMTDNALGWRHRPNVIDSAYYMYKFHLFEDHTVRLVWLLEDSRELQDIDLPDELVPLITRSKDQLLLLLRRGLVMQKWIDSYAQWPTGLFLLLGAGYNPGRQSFRWACEANCLASLGVASVHPNQDIVQLTIQALVDRRKRLQSLAVTCLPNDVLAQLKMRPGCLLNLKAAKAYKLLKIYSIKVDDIEEESEWSVYDAVGCNLGIADQLWHAGFQDVDELDDCGETSLMRLKWSQLTRLGPVSLMEKAYWLISKGADVHRKQSSLPALHFLGRAIGDAIFFLENEEDVRSELSRLDEGCCSLLRRILCDETRDSCDCVCSVVGCCGLTRVLDGIFWGGSTTSTRSLVQKFSVTIDVAANCLGLKHREFFYNQLAPGLFRFLTFNMLDLTHTCTHHGSRNIEPEEVAEIHDEQRYLICTLERLVSELLVEFEKSTEPLPEFLTGRWWLRINEAVSAREMPTHQELDKLYKTGVVFWGYNDAMFHDTFGE